MGKFRETLAESAEGALHLGPERDRVFADLTPEEKERFIADIRAMNILLQGLLKDIYTFINHYTDAKDILDNVKMLIEGSGLTKDERESQFYDEFEHFHQNKGETIHKYYVRFVTAVKLNRGLKQSNYDQLYAYLKQHEAHANENKMLLERYNQHAIDPLALGRQNKGQGNYARGTVAHGNGGVQNRVGNANPGQARQIKCYNYNGIGHIARNYTQPKQPHTLEYFKDKMLLIQTMFMAILSSADLIYDEAGPSYDSYILSEVQDHDNYVDSVDHLNLQLKYQSLKERFGNNKSQPSQDALEFDTVFEINKMKASLQGKDNAIRKLKEKISQMKERRSEADRILDFNVLDFQNIELTEKVTALQEQNALFRAENEKVKQHYKELYDSIKITRAKTIEKTTSLLTENEKLKAQLKGKTQCVTMPAIKPKVLAPGVISSPEAIGSKPRRNTKNTRILPAKSDNKENVEDHLRNNKSNLKQNNCVDYSISSKRPTDRPLVFGLRLLKTYDGESLTAQEFREKVHRDNLEVAFRKHSCYVRNEDGVELLKGSHDSNLYTIFVEDMIKSLQICSLLSTKAYEETNQVFGALCYPTNDSEDLRKLKATTDIGIFVGYAPNRKGYRIYDKITRRIMDTIHVQFDELTEQMAPVHIST
ncbi:integrase, catalytic region, zinc finger, CCHC-type containing protein [Tanacetum coccineum]